MLWKSPFKGQTELNYIPTGALALRSPCSALARQSALMIRRPPICRRPRAVRPGGILQLDDGQAGRRPPSCVVHLCPSQRIINHARLR